jgi:hypothetical protein
LSAHLKKAKARVGIPLKATAVYYIYNDVKSFLEMQLHKSKKHGEKNQMSPYDNKKAFQAQQGGRKERERNADESLHAAIDRWRGKR